MLISSWGAVSHRVCESGVAHSCLEYHLQNLYAVYPRYTASYELSICRQTRKSQ